MKEGHEHPARRTQTTGLASRVRRWAYGIDLDAEQLEAVETERRALNQARVRQISAAVLLIMIGGFVFHLVAIRPENEAQRVWARNLEILVPSAIGTGALLYLAVLRSARFGPVASDLVSVVWILTGALASANVQRARPAMDLFLIASFGAVYAFRARFEVLLGTQALAAAIVSTGIVTLQRDPMMVRMELVTVFIVSSLVVIFGRASLVLLARDVIARALIDRQARALDAHRAELATLNQSLEVRVQTQVAEIVARSEQIDRLNLELREQVKERSRDLSDVLARIQGAERDQPLLAGSKLADRFEIVAPLGREAWASSSTPWTGSRAIAWR
jgi:hypothetical protein